MQDTINLFVGLNDLHWRDSSYQWLFYAGILLTLVLEKRKMLRIVFGWVPLLFLASIFNPISMKLLNLAGLYNQAYFARLFSFMPLMYVIAKGFTLLLYMNDGWLKMAAVGIICTAICFTGKNIYQESWLTKAENYEKVPQDTYQILEAVNDGSNHPVCIAAIDANTIYLRQISDVIMPYGRPGSELGNLLSMDPPDVQRVMEMAGQQDVDYIVTHKTDATLSAFAENSYKPFALTDNYSIFMVEGVSRMRRTLDKNRHISSVEYYNAEGYLESTDVGYSSIVYEYDDNGNTIKESFFDQQGNPFRFFEGYSTIITDYYINGNRKTVSYLDQYGNPIIVDGRYKTRYRYNTKGQTIQETYYNTRGNIIGEAGIGKTERIECLQFYQRTSGARRDQENNICFTTKKEGNRFSAVWFQLFDSMTGEYLLNFGEAYETGRINGKYVHGLPSGLYRLVFRGNTNLADEYISSLEYLREGEALLFRYDLDELQETSVQVSGFYIGREKP